MIRVIAMLTYDDQTVKEAQDIYKQNKSAKTVNWGFKDTNITAGDTKTLSAKMRADGKVFFFESLVTTQEEALEVAKLAIECNTDYIVGMEYFESVHELLKNTGVKYFPTCGRRAGYPRRMLYGEIEEIIADADRILAKGVDGICLSVFRYEDGDPLTLAKRFVEEVKAPLILTGSINSDERLDFVKEVRPWGFTVGSALFEEDQFAGASIADKLDYIYDYLQE